MNNCPFCNVEPAPTPGAGGRITNLLRRAWRGVQWLLPATVLMLIPKCPMCVAAYIALFTGIGISVSAAHWVQILSVAFCISSLGYLLVRTYARLVQRRI